jgi:hypothetical protein
MSKLIKIALAAVAIIGITSSANAATAILATNDFVGISFWIVSMGCLAATAFFFLERGYRFYTLYVYERHMDQYW